MGTSVSAHGVFFADRVDEKMLVLGEGPIDNQYHPSCVKSIDGYTLDGKMTKVAIVPHEKNVAIMPTEQLGMTGTIFDYGYFTTSKDGKMHHQPMNMVKDAVKSNHAIKYNITYWNKMMKPMAAPNLPIQIIPSGNPLNLHKGDTYEIQVLKDGKPFADAPLIKDVINDLTNESKTDKDGKATITVAANGLNVVGVEVAYPTGVKGEQNKYFSSLSFTIYPEE